MNLYLRPIVTLFFALNIYSVEALSEETETLGPVIVTGTKKEGTYFENPEGILLLKEDEVVASGQANGLQVLSGAPNVEVNKNGDSFSIRGISSAGVTGYQKDNLASILVDNIFQTDLALSAGSLSFWDMQGLEILRGAQSTHQGINSLAGNIILNHVDPQGQREGELRLSLGNYDFYELAVVANETYGKKKRLKTRISYQKELNGGYIANVTTKNADWAKWNKDRVMLNMKYDLNAKDVLLLQTKFNRNHQGGQYVQGSEPFNYEVAEDIDLHKITHNYQLGIKYEKIFNERLKNSVYVSSSRSLQDASSDADGLPSSVAGKRDEDHKDYFLSIENRLLYKGNNIENLFGFHAHAFNLKDDYAFNLLYPLGPSASTPIFVDQFVDRDRQTIALFDSFTYKLSTSHIAYMGLRGEYVASSYATNISAERIEDLGVPINTAIDTYISEIDGPYDGKRSQFVFLPKVGYLYKHNKHHWGLQYTRGYRTSGVSINRRRATAVEYDPEYTNNYELSYKYDGGRNLQLGANLFFIDWKDQQVQVQLSGDFYDTQVENAAQSFVYGTELESKIKINSDHNIYAGVGYVQTEFKKFETGGDDYAGNEFPFAANWTGRVTHEWMPLPKLFLFSSLRALSSSYSNADNNKKSDAQFYLDLNARYLFQQWAFSAYINNVLGGEFLIFDGTPSTPSSYVASYHHVNSPRELGLRVSYFW